MSRTNPAICCSRCGKIIYEPLTDKELRQKKYARYVSGYYVVNEDGREDELCKKCYMAWREEVLETDYGNKQDETRKRIKASPDMAIDIMSKYRKIHKIIDAPISSTSAKYNAIVNLIKYSDSEVVEDENVDC